MNQYGAYLGIDWADKKHDLCLVDAASGKKNKLVLAHTPQAIAEYFTRRLMWKYYRGETESPTLR